MVWNLFESFLNQRSFINETLIERKKIVSSAQDHRRVGVIVICGVLNVFECIFCVGGVYGICIGIAELDGIKDEVGIPGGLILAVGATASVGIGD